MGKHITSLPNEQIPPPEESVFNIYGVEECQHILKCMDISFPVIINYKPKRMFEFSCKNPLCHVDTFLAPDQICCSDEVMVKDTGEEILAMICPCPACHKDSYSTKDVSNDITLMRKMRDVINNIKTK